MKDWEVMCYCIIFIGVAIFLLAGGWKILLLLFVAALGV